MLSIAAGSGYWKHNAKPLNYVAPIMWHVLMPLSFVGLNLGGKLGHMVAELPRPVAYQWRSWCLHPKYLGSVEPLRAKLMNSKVPITALAFSDDELMTLAGTKSLFALYGEAAVEIKPIEPREFNLERIGHFGFFRESMSQTLWPWTLAWILERTHAAPPDRHA